MKLICLLQPDPCRKLCLQLFIVNDDNIVNEKLQAELPEGIRLKEAYHEADKVLTNAVFAIAAVISRTGVVNVDFADVSSVMKNRGRALMGVGVASGEDRSVNAARLALQHTLLEDFELSKAAGVLYTVLHGPDFRLEELSQVGDEIENIADPDATVIFGTI